MAEKKAKNKAMRNLLLLVEIPFGVLFRPVLLFSLALIITAIILVIKAPLDLGETFSLWGCTITGTQALKVSASLVLWCVAGTLLSLFMKKVCDTTWAIRHKEELP